MSWDNPLEQTEDEFLEYLNGRIPNETSFTAFLRQMSAEGTEVDRTQQGKLEDLKRELDE